MKNRTTNERGWTLIELLAVIFVISIAIIVGKSLGTGAGLLAGLLSVIVVILFYSWIGRRDERKLKELREKYPAIYRVIAVSPAPIIIMMPEGAEIRIGDYGWEAGPIRSDGLIYLHGLTPDWTVAWHAGFRSDQVEWIATKPYSQYDSWHPFWADSPPLPPCPFPIAERETLTIGRPHHSHCYFEEPAWYPAQRTKKAKRTK